jgi:hypothetical protein
MECLLPCLQNYYDSISVVGSCAFVQTGVIGECNRDGNRCARGMEFCLVCCVRAHRMAPCI